MKLNVCPRSSDANLSFVYKLVICAYLFAIKLDPTALPNEKVHFPLLLSRSGLTKNEEKQR